MIKIRLLKDWHHLLEGSVIQIPDWKKAQQLVNLEMAEEVGTSYLTKPNPESPPKKKAVKKAANKGGKKK
jgi:hypothetical protein